MSLVPDSADHIELTEVDIFGHTVTQIEARFETMLTNDLYTPDNPIVSFTEVLGFITGPNEIRLSATDAMIVPGSPGDDPVDDRGMFYTPVRAEFDANTQRLSFVDSVEGGASDVAVVRTPGGDYLSGSDAADPLVGATVSLPELTFLGKDMDGDFIFDDASFSMTSGSSELAIGQLSNIRIDGSTCQFIADFDGIPGMPTGDFASLWATGRNPFLQLLGPVMTLDLVLGSDEFSQRWVTQTDFINGTVFEPGTLLLIGPALLGVAFGRRRRPVR